MSHKRGWLLAAGLSAIAALASAGAPYTPRDDQQIVETLRQPRLPGMASLRELRARWLTQPTLVPAALAYARAALELSRREEDPRYLGYAQAALAHWWDRAKAPPEVVLLRASLRLARMEYPAAELDLQSLIASDVPEGAAARVTRAGLRLSQGDPVAAGTDCAAAAPHVGPLTAATCLAAVRGLRGDPHGGLAALDAALPDSANAAWGTELWARGVAAELALRIGNPAQARQQFDAGVRRMHAAGSTDPALLAAFADFLLEQGQTATVRALLADYPRHDSLLLRLTLAEQADGRAGDTSAAASAIERTRQLALRFSEMRQRADRSHLRDEALFELEVRGDPAAALSRMTESWTFLRDPVDARLLLRAARAAAQPGAATVVTAWIGSTGVRDRRLDAERAAWQPPLPAR
ncbi:MAG TPA: hypothetical protein PLT77_05870 [Burkholderiaceae bacterium]|nr:hypothetical protein [Burkholderiaceae bacterium]